MDKYEDVLELLDKIKEIDPEFPMFYYDRAEVFKRMGNHEKALQEIDIYLEKFPDDGYAHEKRANILLLWEDLTRPSRNATRPSSLNPSC